VGRRQPAPAGSAVRAFANDEVRFIAGERWTSAASRASYPVEWASRRPPARTECAPCSTPGTRQPRSTGAIYWEGLSELLDERGQRVGLGYLEMTGYAARLRL
jgi:predicted secreted hydrolase